MIANEPFIYYGSEDPIQTDVLDDVRLVEKKPSDLFYFIEFVYIDGTADVWVFTDSTERALAYEYVELSRALYETINKIHAKLN